MTAWKDSVEKRLRELQSLVDQTIEDSYPSRARLEDARLRDALDRAAKSWEVFQIDHSVSSGGTGTMTSLTMPTAVFDVADPTGAAVVTFDTQNENKVFAGPTTPGAATPTFRALVAADLPSGIPGTATVTRITTTGDGTHAHPAGATWIAFDIVGGGGGGGGGRNTANGAANHMGGRGGGGGARLQKVFRLADLPDPIPYHVGAGGTGGAGAAGSSAATGTDGTAGEDTTIGTTTVYGRAGGGGGGAGGSGAGCAGGGGGGTAGTGGSTLAGSATTVWTLGGGPQMFDQTTTVRRGNVGGEGGFGGIGGAGGDSQTGLGAEWGGGGGGGSAADTTTTGRGGTSIHGGGGGGAGGTSHTATIQDGLAGGASGTFIYWNSGSASGGGAGGTSGAAPTAGTAGTAGTSALSGFGGGGGGCSDTNDTAGAAGGAGGACGGGGGGGGGGKGTGAGGNGGNGGRGEIRIATW